MLVLRCRKKLFMEFGLMLGNLEEDLNNQAGFALDWVFSVSRGIILCFSTSISCLI